MQIKQILTHVRFGDPYGNQNGIALLQLYQPLKLSPFVLTVCLPEKDEGDLSIPNEHAIATGRGSIESLRVRRSLKTKRHVKSSQALFFQNLK